MDIIIFRVHSLPHFTINRRSQSFFFYWATNRIFRSENCSGRNDGVEEIKKHQYLIESSLSVDWKIDVTKRRKKKMEKTHTHIQI